MGGQQSAPREWPGDSGGTAVSMPGMARDNRNSARNKGKFKYSWEMQPQQGLGYGIGVKPSLGKKPYNFELQQIQKIMISLLCGIGIKPSMGTDPGGLEYQRALENAISARAEI